MSSVSDFLSELGKRAPQIGLAALAAYKGGPQAVAAFQGGLLEAHQAREAQARQAQLDEERRQLQEAQEARAANADTRAEDAAVRAQQAADLQRLQAAMGQLSHYEQQVGEQAADPAAAENALLGRSTAIEGVFGLKPGQLSPFISNMSAPVGRGVSKDARDLLSDAETRLRKHNAEAEISDATVSFAWPSAPPRLQKWLIAQGHPEGEPFKPSTLQTLAVAPTITAPKPTKDPASVDAAIMAAYQRGDQAELQRLLRLKARMGEAGRAPEKEHEPSTAATRLEESRLDEQLAYFLRHPQEASRARWGDIHRAYEKLGVDYVARRDAIARQVARGSAGDPLAPTADELVSEFDKALAAQSGAPVVPGAGGAPAAPAAGGAQRTATTAQVKKAAKIAGMSEADYRKALAARGVVVKD
jgi:hypothetical protein